MHILWTPSWYPSAHHPFNGTFFAEQVAMLRKAGEKVGVITVDPRSVWQRRRRRTMEDQVIRAAMAQMPKGVVPGDDTHVRLLARSLGRQYEREHGVPDAVHAHSVFPGILLAKHLARRWNIPYGLTEHRPITLDRLRGPRTRAIERAVVNADFRAAVSAPFAAELQASYGAPFETISLPVPERFFEVPVTTKRSERVVFLHVSHLDPNKRAAELISAFADVAETDDNVSLHIIGGTDDKLSELTQRAESCGVLDKVNFLGQVHRADIAAAMSQADCFVLTSAREAAGAVFGEAQALGLPCIGSATWGGRYMVEPTCGVVIPIDDHDALVGAMREMAEGIRAGNYPPEVIRNRARQRFSSQAFTTHQIEMYESAVRTHA